MEVPNWSIGGASFGATDRQDQGFSPRTFDRSDRNEGKSNGWGQLRHVTPSGKRGGGNDGERIRGRNQIPAQVQAHPQMRALAPTGTSPADVEPRATATLVASDRPFLNEGIYQATDVNTELPIVKTMRVYPFAVNLDRLAESACH